MGWHSTRVMWQRDLGRWNFLHAHWGKLILRHNPNVSEQVCKCQIKTQIKKWLYICIHWDFSIEKSYIGYNPHLTWAKSSHIRKYMLFPKHRRIIPVLMSLLCIDRETSPIKAIRPIISFQTDHSCGSK